MIQTSARLPPRIELVEFGKYSDPYPLYRQLREAGPICRAGGNQWLLTRYADVAKHLRNPNLKQFQIAGILEQFPKSASIQAIRDDPATRFTERILAGRDGTVHRELRGHMARALKASLTELDALVSRELDEILAPLRAQGAFDAVRDLAFELPIRTLARIVGLPAEHRQEVAELSLRLAHVFSPQFIESERKPVNEAVERLRAIVGEILDGRADARSGGGLFAQRFHDQAKAAFSQAEIIDNIIFLLFAGFETSLNVLSNGIAALLQHPDEFHRLQENPSLLETAIEEFLRFDSPVHLTGRIVSEPEVVAGQRIGRGRVVYLALASANRDPSVFEAPDRLDIGRRRNPHVAFGGGAHLCLGTHIARSEARHLFSKLAGSYKGLEACGPPVRNISATFRTLKSLPVRVTP